MQHLSTAKKQHKDAGPGLTEPKWVRDHTIKQTSLMPKAVKYV